MESFQLCQTPNNNYLTHFSQYNGQQYLFLSMGCVPTNKTPPAKATPSGTVAASTANLHRTPTPQTTPIATTDHLVRSQPIEIKPSNPSSNLLSSGNDLPTNMRAPTYQPLNTVDPYINILDSNLSAGFNRNSAGVGLSNQLGEVKENEFENSRIKQSQSNVYVSELEELKKNEHLNSQSPHYFDLSKSNDKPNSIINSIEKDLPKNISSSYNATYIPNFAPYPQKPNFDWVKDIDEENFDKRLEVIAIPSIDLKIS